MKYLSVCSGIEAASVAWHPLGWEPLAFSEIEKFPRKVLAHHYPNVPLHGDFTVLREQEWIKDADILVGGTPCQAFSVAGLRNSLDDDRGNLTLEFVRLADAIDNLRRTGTIIVWENVPGVLSVKDNAFGCFLAAITGNDAPLVPTGGKWTNAGMVVGPKRTAAWRILDAQYFGVAQRRRRVFVVASSRDDFDPAEVLFEREGMRRDIAPRREPGQKPSATIAARFGISRNNHEEVVTQFVGEVAPTLTKEGTGVVRPGFQEDGWYVAACFDRQRSDEYGTDDIASTMSARDFKAATDLVAQPIPLDTMNIIERPSDKRRANRIGRGYGEAGDPMFTITKGHSHAVAQPYSIMPMNSGKDYKARETDVSQPIMAAGPSGGNQGGDYVVQPMAFAQNTRDEVRYINGDGQIVGALAAESGMKQTNYIAQTIAVGTDLYNGNITGDVAATMGTPGISINASGPTVMQAMAYASSDGKVRILNDVMSTLDSAGESRGTNQQRFIHQEMAVRRLTPRECERLQGFPDDYTAIPGAADGPRYKSLGNSMAVPVMAWIGKKIANEHH